MQLNLSNTMFWGGTALYVYTVAVAFYESHKEDDGGTDPVIVSIDGHIPFIGSLLIWSSYFFK